MNSHKMGILGGLMSLAFVFGSISAPIANATTVPAAGDKKPEVGIEKLDMTGAPQFQFFKSLPKMKPADANPSTQPNTPSPINTAPGNTAPAASPTQPTTAPAVTQTPSIQQPTPGSSPDITPQQVEKFLADRGFDADKAKAAAAPTPEMLDGEFLSIWQFVGQKYFNGDKLNHWENWPARYAGKLKTREDLNAAVATMLASLGDRWTVFTSIESILRASNVATPDQEYLGVGLSTTAKGTYRVEVLDYKSPAWNSNSIRPGDEVKEVDTYDTKGSVTKHPLAGMAKEDANKLMVGTKGGKITLVVGHDGKEESVDMAFADTPPEQIEVGMLPNHIGYVRLPSFGTSEDEANTLGNNFLRALAMLDGAAKGNLQGIVLDLRANHGGAVDLAKKIARIFIDHGTFLQTQERDGGTDKFEKDVFRAPQAYEYVGAPKELVGLMARLKTVPLTVLVDGSSASSAEILTGTLKDNGRAVVIGTQTFGKAVAFVRIPTPAGMLQVTTMHYLTPNGSDLAGKGITPDVILDRSRGVSSYDEQLVAAAQILLSASNTLATKPDPSAVQTQGGDDGFGLGSLLSMGLGLGLVLLAIALTVANNRARKERDEKEKQDRDSGKR